MSGNNPQFFYIDFFFFLIGFWALFGRGFIQIDCIAVDDVQGS